MSGKKCEKYPSYRPEHPVLTQRRRTHRCEWSEVNGFRFLPTPDYLFFFFFLHNYRVL